MTIKCSPLLASGFLLFLALALPSQAALTDNLLTHLNFDNSTSADSTKLRTVTAVNGQFFSSGAWQGTSFRTYSSADYLLWDAHIFDSRPAVTLVAFLSNRLSAGKYGMLWSDRAGSPASIEVYPNGAGLVQVDLKTASGTCYLAATGPKNTWFMVSVTYNSSYGARMFFNSSLVATDTSGCGGNVLAGSTVAKVGFGVTGESLNGSYDRVSVWNRTLSAGEINQVYTALGDPFPAPAGVTASIVMSFLNKTGSVKTVFLEGEEFRPRANFTLSGLNINGASCNATFYNTSIESVPGSATTTICKSACANTTIVGVYNRSKTGLTTDVLHFTPCHPAGSGTLNVRFCGAAAISVPAASFPNCPSTALIFLNSSACKTKGYFAYNITTTSNFANRITISALERDAFYSSVITPMTQNATTKVWNSGFVEFYAHQTNKVNVSCKNSTYAATATKSFTIVNSPPFVAISGFSFDDTTTATIPGVVEYRAGVWNLLYQATDDDIKYVRFQLRNSTQILKTQVSGNAESFGFNATLVTRIGNYNVSVRVNDTFGNTTYKSSTFTINDTINPTITFLSPLANQIFERPTQNNSVFGVRFDDANLYGFWCNLTDATNNVLASWQNTTLNGKTTHTFSNTTKNTAFDDGTYSLNCKVCDGHTAQDITGTQAKTELNKVFVGSVTIEAVGAKSATLNQKVDRYSYGFSYDTIKGEILAERTFRVVGTSKVDIIPRSKYAGHLVVDAAYWVDFEGEGRLVSVTRESPNVVVVVVEVAATKDAQFNSIGKLNCVSAVRSYRIETEHPLFTPGDTGNAIFVIGILFFMLASIAWAEFRPDAYVWGFFAVFVILLAALMMFSVWPVFGWLLILFMAVYLLRVIGQLMS